MNSNSKQASGLESGSLRAEIALVVSGVVILVVVGGVLVSIWQQFGA